MNPPYELDAGQLELAAKLDARMSASEIGQSLRYFDRDGEPISYGTWTVLSEDKRYQHVKVTDVGEIRVSTVWLGTDHAFGMNVQRPVIFETMVFGIDDDREYQWRYMTEDEAVSHHDRLADQLRQGLPLS